MRLDLTWDQVEPLVRQVLRDDLRHLRTSPEFVFHNDAEMDKVARKEMMAAIRKVQEWFGK